MRNGWNCSKNAISPGIASLYVPMTRAALPRASAMVKGTPRLRQCGKAWRRKSAIRSHNPRRSICSGFSAAREIGTFSLKTKASDAAGSFREICRSVARRSVDHWKLATDICERRQVSDASSRRIQSDLIAGRSTSAFQGSGTSSLRGVALAKHHEMREREIDREAHRDRDQPWRPRPAEKSTAHTDRRGVGHDMPATRRRRRPDSRASASTRPDSGREGDERIHHVGAGDRDQPGQRRWPATSGSRDSSRRQ